jgi:ribonuclease P protein component
MKSGVRSRDECFNVCALATALPHARLGVTVAKRVSAKAVARNRIKRQIRESFRRHQSLLHGVSVVVTAQPVADRKDNAQLRASLSKHWDRVTQACKQSRSQS